MKRVVFNFITLLYVLWIFSKTILSKQYELYAIPASVLTIFAVMLSVVPEELVKMGERIAKCISTPIKWYVIGGVIGALDVALYFLFDCSTKLSTFLISIGTGLIASVVIAFLIDIGNTKRNKEKDKTVFDKRNEELYSRCKAFPELMCSDLLAIGMQTGGIPTSLSFCRGLEILCFDRNVLHKNEVDSWLKIIRSTYANRFGKIDEVITENMKLQDVYPDNPFLGEEYIYELKGAKCGVEQIIEELENIELFRNLDIVPRAHYLFYESMLALFPDLKSEFTKTWQTKQ